MQSLVDKLSGRVNKIVEGGGQKAILRHTDRGKKSKAKAKKKYSKR
jgi:hypothetical protein